MTTFFYTQKKGDFKMEQQQISPKKQKALEKVKRANTELAKVVREETDPSDVEREVPVWLLKA